MFDPSTIILLICLYIGFLFLIAAWTERKTAAGESPADNPIVYTLSLAIYCTAWTLHGGVGAALSSGMLFLTIYLGPTLCCILWWTVLRKLARIKQSHRVNSIADFFAVRYGASHPLAAIAAVFAAVGVAPYIALQFRAVVSTFGVITSGAGMEASWIGDNAGLIVAGVMIAAAIAFGMRRLDPTERRQGLVTAAAAEALVKLLTLLIAGVFITFFLFDGPGEIFQRLAEASTRENIVLGKTDASFATWVVHLVLAMSAVLFLPGQFHVAVVENSNENHIRTAMWLFPLYLFLITLFVFPAAMGGRLMGLPAREADLCLMVLPLHLGNPWLTLLLFIGGFSAAACMIMITAMTMAAMISNHLLAPLADRTPGSGFLRARLLKARWASAAAVILLGCWFERRLGGGGGLAGMGMISFAAALQFAPAILGGIFWRGANKTGAILGLSAGFFLWFYTLLLPAFARGGQPSDGLLQNGPWGVEILHPEHLLGVTGLEPLAHGVFWTMVFNIGLYILGSLLHEENEEERKTAGMIVDALIPAERTRGIDYHKEREALISSHAAALEEKVGELEKQIRERERIEEVLRKAEARHRTLLTVTPDPIVALDFNGSVTYINPAFEKTYGWSREEVLGQRTRGWTGGEAPMERIEFIPEHEDQKTWDALKRNFKGENVSLETQRFTKDGRLLDIHLNTAVFDLESDNPGVIVIHRDISKRKRAEKDLRRLRNLMKEIIDSMPSMLVGVDPEGRVTQWNREAEKATGVTAKEARGWLLKEAFPGLSGQMSHVRRAIRERAPVKDAKAPHQVDGEIRYWDVTVYPLVSNDVEGAVIRVDDVTERARIDEMIVQTEKMVSVGGLAAGMAHEINNPLAGVLQNVQVIRNRVAGDLPKNRRTAEACGVSMDIIKTYMDRRGIPETIDTVMESGHRAAVIVDNMLSFSRKSASDFIPHRVPELLDKTLKLAENDYSLKSKFDFREIRIVREYAPSLPKVPCEGSKIQQVFLNLLKNGAQAMAANRERKTPPSFILRVRPEGHQVRVEIEDNGPGIDEAVRKRVFEPFFTTKEVGVGTGLGLSVSYFIITENHKGAISVESTPGEGAKFIIHLPVNRPAEDATPPVGSLR